MDVRLAVAAMDSEESLVATRGRGTKANVPKKLLSMEEKGVEAAKRRGRRMNLKERKNAAVA
jgi:hypothetical protein